MKFALSGLLFDVDGTLADTEEIHRRCFNAAFAEAGLSWSWNQQLYKKLLEVTGGRERIRFFLDRYPQQEFLPDDLDGFIAGLHRSKTAFYTATLAGGEVPLRPGVARLVKEACNNGLRLAVVTTTTPENVTALLEHSFESTAAGCFEVIAAGSVVPNKKPAPDIYHYTLEKLGLPAEQCLALEDSAHGLHSALNTGMPVVITVNPYTKDQDFTGAALVVDQLGDPGNPCHMISGELDPGGMIDTTFLHRLHAHCLAHADVQCTSDPGSGL